MLFCLKKKSRLTFGLRKTFTFPSIFTHDLSSKKRTEVLEVALRDIVILRHVKRRLVWTVRNWNTAPNNLCNLAELGGSKTTRGRPIADLVRT